MYPALECPKFAVTSRQALRSGSQTSSPLAFLTHRRPPCAPGLDSVVSQLSASYEGPMVISAGIRSFFGLALARVPLGTCAPMPHGIPAAPSVADHVLRHAGMVLPSGPLAPPAALLLGCAAVNTLSATQRRWAARRVGAVARNGRSTPGRRLGIKVNTGEFVRERDILVRQRGLRFHPGPNTVVGHDQTLNATEDGIAHIYNAYFTFPLKYSSHMSVRKRRYIQVLTPKSHPQLFNDKNQLLTLDGAILETDFIRRNEDDARRLVNNRKNAQENPKVFKPRLRFLKKIDSVIADKVVTDAMRMQLGDEHWMVKERELEEQQKYGSATKHIPRTLISPK